MIFPYNKLLALNKDEYMAYNLKDTLVVGISSTSLFDLTEEDLIFHREFKKDKNSAMKDYRKLMLEREDEKLEPGAGYPLIQSLLTLNDHCSDGAPLVEVVVMSRNSPETGMRLLNSLRAYGLPISRTMFTGGESVVDYLNAYSVDLFLSTSSSDAQIVADSEVCATAVLSTPPEDSAPL
ncbi:MAG: 5'-nucleotidase, partial [Oceanospirillaceae bacterium]